MCAEGDERGCARTQERQGVQTRRGRPRPAPGGFKKHREEEAGERHERQKRGSEARGSHRGCGPRAHALEIPPRRAPTGPIPLGRSPTRRPALLARCHPQRRQPYPLFSSLYADRQRGTGASSSSLLVPSSQRGLPGLGRADCRDVTTGEEGEFDVIRSHSGPAAMNVQQTRRGGSK